MIEPIRYPRRATHDFPDDPDAPEWLQTLRAACRADGITATAARLGYARSSISLVVHGQYPSTTREIEKAVTRYLDAMVPCPHLGRPITTGICAAAGAGPMPKNDPDRFRLWTACRTCPLNPRPKESR